MGLDAGSPRTGGEEIVVRHEQRGERRAEVMRLQDRLVMVAQRQRGVGLDLCTSGRHVGGGDGGCARSERGKRLGLRQGSGS